MKRECLRLLADARSGNHFAQRAVAQHYLQGTAGFPKYPRLGFEYLNHPMVKGSPEASLLVARSLSLAELLAMECDKALRFAADLGDPSALLKLACWESLAKPTGAAAWALLQRASRQDALHSDVALRAWKTGDTQGSPARLLTVLEHAGLVGSAHDVAMHAAGRALDSRDVVAAQRALFCAAVVSPEPDEQMARALCRTLVLVQELDAPYALHAAPRFVQAALEGLSADGDADAAYMLGRAYCQLPWGRIMPEALVAEFNLRKGVALLLRAADAGRTTAWIDLHRLHSKKRSSVDNPGMAVFCLEKAALLGCAIAQRHIGAELLRRAQSIRGFEQGIAWLHRASLQGDRGAKVLLESLVVRVEGDESSAQEGLRLLEPRHPQLAARLRVARHFGLTRAEALSFCPVGGTRSWGLVVDRNPLLVQPHLASPRAVPAVTEQARRSLADAFALFSVMSPAHGEASEGTLRQRGVELRRALRRLCVDEALFFAKLGASTALAMKIGSTWAYRHRHLLFEVMTWEASTGLDAPPADGIDIPA